MFKYNLYVVVIIRYFVDFKTTKALKANNLSSLVNTLITHRAHFASLSKLLMHE